MKLNKLLAQTPKKGTVIPTGFSKLDSLIGGLHLGEVCTIGARPSNGMTALTMSLAKNIGILNKIPTAIFSLQYNEAEVVKRLIAAELGWVDIEELKASAKDPSSAAKEAINRLQNLGFKTDRSKADFLQLMKEAPLWIEQITDFTVPELMGKIERITKENNLKVIVLDALDHLFNITTHYVEWERTLRDLKQLADRLDVAILLTTGVLREVERRIGCRPYLYDLRMGTDIFSSIVFLLYRPEYYGITEDDQGSTIGVCDITVAKNTHGQLGTMRLRIEDHARFIEPTNIQNIEEEIMSIEEDIF